MKKRIQFLTMVLFLFGLMAVLSACDHTPKPGDRFKEYVALWKKQDFSKMYTYLTAATKKRISKSDFTSRYKAIYSGINANHLKVTFNNPKNTPKPDKNGNIHYNFKVQMDTQAGPVSFKEQAALKKESVSKKNNWYVNWTPAMIFPGMQTGDKVRIDTTPSTRGQIFDRNHKGLAINGVAAQIGIEPGKLNNKNAQTTKALAKLLNVPTSFVDAQLKQSWVKADSFVPIKTIDATNTKLIKETTQLPGVLEEDTKARVYPCKEACAHLTGYVGPITADQLKKLKDKGYDSQSVIGRSGLEQVLENQLRGIDGAKLYIVKKDGTTGKTIAEKKAKNGQDVQLTIDSDVQKSLYSQMKGNKGAASAINPVTGDVLGLVSTPSYDPNKFVLGMTNSEYQKLNTNPDKPLLNRFSATFTSGSIFKPITAAVALDKGTITPQTSIAINGLKWQKDKSWGDFYVTRLDGLPQVNLQNALVYSDNVFFAQTALKVGGKAFENFAKKIGFGEALPIKFPMEKSVITNGGNLETSDTLLANTGYGQGQNNVNPLFMDLYYSAFVNNGSMIKPHLIMQSNQKPSYWKAHVMTSKTANIIKNDLIQVVQKPYGTAHDTQVSGLSMAAKTGTAEFKEKQNTTGKEDGWVVAFNTDQPKFLVSIMIQDVQKKRGSHYVEPMIKNVFRKYFNK